MKKLIFPIFLLITISSICQTVNSIFSGFTLLSLPRDSFPVGAQWNSSVGPISSGIDSKFLKKTGSVANYEVDNSSTFNAGMRASILNWIGLGGTYLNDRSLSIVLKDVTILGVDDILRIQFSDESIIIWEALKAASVEIKYNLKSGDTLGVNINPNDKELSIIANQNLKKNRVINITGKDMYFAYRLMQVGKHIDIPQNEPKPIHRHFLGREGSGYFYEDNKPYVFNSSGTCKNNDETSYYYNKKGEAIGTFKTGGGSFNKGFSYKTYDDKQVIVRGDIFNLEEFTRTFDMSEYTEINPNQKGSIVLLITLNNEMFNGKPKMYRLNINRYNNNSESFSQTIRTTVSAGYIEVLQLGYNCPKYLTLPDCLGYPDWDTKYTITGIRYPIKQFESRGVPGW